jgi:molybdopterin converting factor small subunit
MPVTVRLFAVYAEKFGKSQIDLEMGRDATVADVVSALSGYHGASSLPVSPLAAVNCVYATPLTPVHDGDEVALIPPVAGG